MMMKERYTSPEMKVLCFAPAEKLAATDIEFDDFYGFIAGKLELNEVKESTYDVDVRR